MSNCSDSESLEVPEFLRDLATLGLQALDFARSFAEESEGIGNTGSTHLQSA
jgi:hypothetical protein